MLYTMERSNEELALLLFQAMNDRDFTLLDPYLHPEVAFDFPGAGRMEGVKRVTIFLKALLRKYPVLIFNVYETVVDGDLAVAVWNNHGKNLAGHPYQNSGMTLIHFESGKITFISDYFKDTSFVQ